MLVLALAAAAAPGTMAESPPPLQLVSPAHGSTTNQPTILVAGTTSPGTSVVVNGYVVAVGADGNFSVQIALRPGANTINATASLGSGVSTSVVVETTFIDPSLVLGEELSAAQANVTSLQMQLHSAESNATVLEAQVEALDEELTVKSLELTKTKGDLASANNNIVSITGQLAGVSMLAGLALLAALAAIGLVLVQARRGRGAGAGPSGAGQVLAGGASGPVSQAGAAEAGGAMKGRLSSRAGAGGEAAGGDAGDPTRGGVTKEKPEPGGDGAGANAALGSETSQAEAAAGTVEQHQDR